MVSRAMIPSRPNQVDDWINKPSVPKEWYPPRAGVNNTIPEDEMTYSQSLVYNRRNLMHRSLFHVMYFAREVTHEDIEHRFQRLAREWREDVELSSSMTEIVMHPKYQSIIGLGPKVVPILLQELQDNPDYWFWALRAITEDDPIRPEDYGDLQKMANAWLEWASNKGYR